MSEKIIKYDIDGYDILTKALMELVNQYPGLSPDDTIAFVSLPADGGKALHPISGAIVETERRSVTGRVRRVCLYPFYLYYRVSAGLSEERKITVKEWLDNLGRWLEGEETNIDGVGYQLVDYPQLTGAREIIAIERVTPAFPNDPAENNMQDWVIHMTVRYKHEYALPTSLIVKG